MIVTYQVESFDIAWPEMTKLFPLHYEEVARDKNLIKLSPNHAKYKMLADAGMYHILTMRCDGIIVGYGSAYVYPHDHYCNDLMAFTDLYFLNPQFRIGRYGINLLKQFEESLNKRGCVKIFTATKLHDNLDNSKIFERLGYTFVEKIYSKILKKGEGKLSPRP